MAVTDEAEDAPVARHEIEQLADRLRDLQIADEWEGWLSCADEYVAGGHTDPGWNPDGMYFVENARDLLNGLRTCVDTAERL